MTSLCQHHGQWPQVEGFFPENNKECLLCPQYWKVYPGQTGKKKRQEAFTSERRSKWSLPTDDRLLYVEGTEYSTKFKWLQAELPGTKSRPKLQLHFYASTTSLLQGTLRKQSHFSSRKGRKLRNGCKPGRERLTRWQLLWRKTQGNSLSGREELILLKGPHEPKQLLD